MSKITDEISAKLRFHTYTAKRLLFITTTELPLTKDPQPDLAATTLTKDPQPDLAATIVKEKSSGKSIAITSTPLSVTQISEAQAMISASQPDITLSCYCCNTSTASEPNPESFHFIAFTKKGIEIHHHANGNLKTTAALLAHYHDLKTNFPNLKITAISYDNPLDTIEQIFTPFAQKLLGKPRLVMDPVNKQEQLDAYTNFSALNPEVNKITSEQLNAVLSLREDSDTALASALRLSPLKLYFYITAILASEATGFQHNRLQQEYGVKIFIDHSDITSDQEISGLEDKGMLAFPFYAADKDLPLIGRSFYDPKTGRVIAVMAPGDEDPALNSTLEIIKDKCDIIVTTTQIIYPGGTEKPTRLSSNQIEAFHQICQALGFSITDLEEFICHLFAETPDATHKTYRHESEGEREVACLVKPAEAQAQAEKSTGTDENAPTTPQKQTEKAAQPLLEKTPAHQIDLKNSPRKVTTTNKENIEKASRYITPLRKRLPPALYYTACAGLLETQGCKEKEDKKTTKLFQLSTVDASREYELPSGENITLHAPCSLEEALSKAETATLPYIFIINEPEKPLAILLKMHKSSGHQLLAASTPKRKLGDAWGEKPENIDTPVPVECQELTDEYLVFFKLQKLLNIGLTTFIPRPSKAEEQVDCVIAYSNFMLANLHPDKTIKIDGKHPTIETLSVNPLVKENYESAMVSAFRQTAQTAYEMGMPLLKRIQNKRGQDLLFIFRQPGPKGLYFILTHPTHPKTVSSKQMERLVNSHKQALESELGHELPLDQLEIIAYKDQLHRYEKPAKPDLSEENEKQLAKLFDGANETEKTRLCQVNGFTQSSLDNKASSRADLAFKRRLISYINNNPTDLHRKITVHKKGDLVTAVVVMVNDDKKSVIPRPFHPQGPIKKHMLTPEKLGLAKDDSCEETHYLREEDALYKPRQRLTITRHHAGKPYSRRVTRAPLCPERKATAKMVNAALNHMGLEKTERSEHDVRPAYKFIPKIWVEIKNHFIRNWRWYALAGTLLATTVACSVLTFGAGALIPALLSKVLGTVAASCLTGSSAVATIGTAGKIIHGYTEEIASEVQDKKRIKQEISTLDICKRLSTASLPAPAPAPAAPAAPAPTDQTRGTKRSLFFRDDVIITSTADNPDGITPLEDEVTPPDSNFSIV